MPKPYPLGARGCLSYALVHKVIRTNMCIDAEVCRGERAGWNGLEVDNN